MCVHVMDIIHSESIYPCYDNIRYVYDFTSLVQMYLNLCAEHVYSELFSVIVFVFFLRCCVAVVHTNTFHREYSARIDCVCVSFEMWQVVYLGGGEESATIG